MSYSKLILRDSADIVWPLDDLTESTTISRAINFFDNNPDLYSASININNTNVIYNPIVYGGGTSLNFTSSAIGLSIPALGRFSELYESRDSAISFWFKSDQLFHDEYPIFRKRGYDNVGLFIKDNYLIFRYGTSSSFIQSAGDHVNFNEPTHVMVEKSNSGLAVIINGIVYSQNNENFFKLPEDNNHINNDYLDFYGPPEGSWIIDSITFYPNAINPSLLKRHYVYGLGKNIGDDIFFSRGGTFYNFSTISTERIMNLSWIYPQEWKFSTLKDLQHENDGIKPIVFNNPTFYTYDNLVNTASNSIKFTSSSTTQASYIEFNQLYSKINNGSNPFFVKVKLDGQLPPKYLSQRIMSYGVFPNEEIVKFNLYNNDGTYQLNIISIDDTASVSFNINNISSSPDIYVGMKFAGYSTFYFAENGGDVESKSFNYYDANGVSVDPLVSYFPSPPDAVIRIGSALTYDKNTFNSNSYSTEQFYGTFKRFFVAQPDLTASMTYSYLDEYSKVRYESKYDSSLNRFKLATYGYGEFNIHGMSMAHYINDDTQILGANVIDIGYPDVQSSSQVTFYATLMSYSGSTLYPQTKLEQHNYLGFINNINLSETYLKFDFEVYGEDVYYYPPKIKYFNMETFFSTDGNVVLRDDAGEKYTLYPSASSIYLPDIRYTPSIFLSEISGLKLSNTKVDFSEKILPKPLNPKTISGLKVWLDARFINGLGKVNLSDDSRVNSWKDLSGNGFDAIQNVSASAPVFRIQSLNLLRNNQANGSDGGDLSFISASNCSVISSPDGSISGDRGLKLIPNNINNNSFVDISSNTASITVFPNQSYSVVATIKLSKPQTASSLHNLARSIYVSNINGGAEVFSASVSASNIAGTYNLYTTFTTASNTTAARLRLYNGSFDEHDVVYFDNIGLYPLSGSVYTSSWVQPLTSYDRATVKFDGINTFLQSTASVTQPYSLYMVGRIFGDGTFINSASSSFYNTSGSYYINNGTAGQISTSDNEFNIYTILVQSGSAMLYINGQLSGSKTAVGSNSLSSLIIGKGNKMLAGDISSVVLFDGYHNYITRSTIENWLDESYNLPSVVSAIDPVDDDYPSSYLSEY